MWKRTGKIGIGIGILGGCVVVDQRPATAGSRRMTHMTSNGGGWVGLLLPGMR